MIRVDRNWLDAHPLPDLERDTDKNERGRVLVVGGSRFVPGALRLTGEAALRAGAGKLQLATVADAALTLGMMLPEAAVIAVPADDAGEIDGAAAIEPLSKAIASCNTVIIGPAMSSTDASERLVPQLVALAPQATRLLLDAAAIKACRACSDIVRSRSSPVVLTPHLGEMAELTDRDIEWIEANMAESAAQASDDLGVVLVLKSRTTIIASPGAAPLLYEGGGPGLATGGSGDVLAGVLGALLARGGDATTAAAWAVWVHGEAGRGLSREFGGPGLLARELPEKIPELLNTPSSRAARR